MITQDDLKAWCQERFPEILEEGGLSIVGLVHYSANGSETPLHALTSKLGPDKWNAERVAEVMDQVASRYARGLPGVQQFALVGTYGTNGRPKTSIPFQRAGSSHLGPAGIGTEGPSELGRTAQAQRWGEAIVTDVFRSLGGLHGSQQSAIESRDRRIRELEGENRELFLALRQELERTVQLAHERRLKELEFIRTTEERRRLIQIMPALANAMTGKEIFPTSTEDSALIETLCANVSEKEIQMFASMLGQKSPELSGLMMARFNAIQQKKLEEQEELRRLAAEATGGTFEQAERDAMGQPIRALRGQAGDIDEQPNGPGPSGQSAAATASEDTDTRLMSDFFTRLGPEAGVLLGLLEEKDPRLAQRLRARHAAMTNGGRG
jgi:hypothetical protein